MSLPPRIAKGGLPPRKTKVRSGMSAGHLAFIRTLPCCLCGRREVEAHHLLRTGERGTGMKSPDRYAIPLCGEHHRGLHAAGDEDAYLAARGVDGRALADRLWRVSGDGEQGERAVSRAKAVR